QSSASVVVAPPLAGQRGYAAAATPPSTLTTFPVDLPVRGPAKNAIASATPDWGTAALACRRLGPQAQVLVDTGHHPMGTNIEQIVALLIEEGLLGGFHFNNRKYADDDLIVGSIDPFELFRIMSEIIGAGAVERIDFMIDQSHNVEGKIDAMMQSVVNIQTAYAKALLVDRDALAAAQAAGDVLGAHRILVAAFETDVRPLLTRHRAALGLEADPVEAFRAGGYAETRAHERGTFAVESAYY
ncbi:MAG: hypothetical protein H0V40_05600, partial [Actinobacteria bacterium]|nr:hypothetical protein [Actinomycetota bacterium]